MTTPSKYAPEVRDWEDKHWLQEQYWSEMKTLKEIAEEVDVSKRTISKRFEQFGIPRREFSWQRDTSKSPFHGFYNDENAPTSGNEVNTAAYDPEKENDNNLDWSNHTRV